MKKLFVLMALSLSINCFCVAQTNKKQIDSKEVCRSRNYNDNRAAKIAEKPCLDRNTSGLTKGIERAVKESKQNDYSEKKDGNSSKGSTASTSNGTRSTSSKSCSSCSSRANDLKNSRK